MIKGVSKIKNCSAIKKVSINDVDLTSAIGIAILGSSMLLNYLLLIPEKKKQRVVFYLLNNFMSLEMPNYPKQTANQ